MDPSFNNEALSIRKLPKKYSGSVKECYLATLADMPIIIVLLLIIIEKIIK